MSFIKASGNIISEEFCDTLVHDEKSAYIKDASFGIKKVDETIATTFELLRERWEKVRTDIINDKLDNQKLRKRWIIPFLEQLGFEPAFVRQFMDSDAGISYHINYQGWEAENAPKIHIVHTTQDLDNRDTDNRTHPKKSPHDMTQTYLNTSADKWAIVTNGKKIRILRDFFHSITKGYLEFDIESIFETANTEQFRVLYRILHRSRFVGQNEKEEETTCLLEDFHKKSREEGIKVGNKLRDQVIEAIETLGNGFATSLNPDEYNDAQTKAFYAEILNIIYRILFLLFAEQKGWLPVRNEWYSRTYSIIALRELALRGDYSHDNEKDLWEGLKITFKLVLEGYEFPNGDTINAFGGQLFKDKKIKTIKDLTLPNRFLLKAIDALSYFEANKVKNRINYATLAIDELGSVYESLLDYNPQFLKKDLVVLNKTKKGTEEKLIGRRGEFILDDRSTDRKTTGSYYTDSRLVAQLIESALIPVIEEAVKDKMPEAQEKALLDLKVADIACGSGAFLISALEKLGETLAIIRKGEEDRPTENQLREAKRDVLLNCIYGVDLNPMAIELAKFSLWITAAMPNMPLTFLDHKIKHGNSLVGATPDLIRQGIPVEAFNPVTLDNKDICTKLKSVTRKHLEQLHKKGKIYEAPELFSVTEDVTVEYMRKKVFSSQQSNAKEVADIEATYKKLQHHEQEYKDWLLADVWTAAFFIKKDDPNIDFYPTNITLENIKNDNQLSYSDTLDGKINLFENTQQTATEIIKNKINAVRKQYRFFHFHLEFPDVFKNGGFDCILGNPPWERVKTQEKEFFQGKNEAIAKAAKKERVRLMKRLKVENTVLYDEFQNALNTSDNTAKFLLKSNRYPLLGRGDVNTYTVFTENFRNNINPKGRMGIIVPSGIATDDTTKFFFQDIVEKRNLVSLYDFENKKGLFAEVHRMFKFCLLTILGGSNPKPFDFLFFATALEDLREENRHFELTSAELFNINPNTGNCPIFRSKKDAELVKSIYKNHPIIFYEATKYSSWNIKFKVMFHMSNDSSKFLRSPNKDNDLSILYEAKMIWQYDYRYGTYEGQTSTVSTNLKKSDINQLVNSNYLPTPRYWIKNEYVEEKIGTSRNWLSGWRDITNATNERTLISSIIPKKGVADTFLLYSLYEKTAQEYTCFLANLNSFVMDFIARQKVAGVHLKYNVFKQLAIISPNLYSNSIKKIISDRVLQLIYTSYHTKPFAEDLDYHDEPFKWNESERFQLQCELDAIYGHLYGLTEAEFDYILETFPIVKRKDIAKYGRYRTKETILEMFRDRIWEIDN
jgi:hypothetical protein